MARVLKSDINQIEAYIESALSEEESQTTELINKINAFTDGSTSTLQGDAWDKERNRLKTFIPALNIRKELCNTLRSAISSANSIMSNYMDEINKVEAAKKYNLNNEDLNNDCLNELEKTLANAKNYQADLVNQSNSDKILESEKEKIITEINNYEVKIKQLKELIDYLSKLTPTDNEANGKYEEALSKIANLKSKLGDVEALYAPPAPKINYVYNTVYVQAPSSNSNSNSNTKASTTQQNTTNETSNTQQNTNTNATPASTITISNQMSNNSNNSNSNSNSNNNTSTTNENINNENETIIVNNSNNNNNTDNQTRPIIPNDNTNTNTNTTIRTTTNRSNNTLKNIGIATVGIAAAGAAGYAGYNAIKNAKNNNEIDDEEDNYDDNYSDNYDDNVDIKVSNDDI